MLYGCTHMATVGIKGLDQGRVYALLTVMKMLFELTRRPQSGVRLLQQLLGTATSVWLANQPLVNQSLGDELPQHWYYQHISTQTYTHLQTDIETRVHASVKPDRNS